jgi:hypothetical protein
MLDPKVLEEAVEEVRLMGKLASAELAGGWPLRTLLCLALSELEAAVLVRLRPLVEAMVVQQEETQRVPAIMRTVLEGRLPGQKMMAANGVRGDAVAVEEAAVRPRSIAWKDPSKPLMREARNQ